MIKDTYNKIRPYLPKKIAVHNGVPVKSAALFDITDVRDNWEIELIRAIRSNVKTGDNVVEIGTGLGVSAVVAARHVGDEGRVTTYEVDKDRVSKARDVIKLNKMVDRVEVIHGAVGEVQMEGYFDAPQISLSELPECDVLISDCEGAEIEILSEYTGCSDIAIIETHAPFGSSTEDIVDILKAKGYTVGEIDSMEEGIDIVTFYG